VVGGLIRLGLRHQRILTRFVPIEPGNCTRAR
jgi:hypothetical protein